jgi:hypothetical protein
MMSAMSEIKRGRGVLLEGMAVDADEDESSWKERVG